MGIPISNGFLDKSWLFEIYNTMTSTVEKSFTLILPPNTVIIKEPQRVNIQKTFNNVFVDDYGPDNIEIQIKAISGTTAVFPTYQSSAAGESATFAFGAGYTGFGAPTPATNPLASTIFSANATGSLSTVNPTGGYDGRSAFYKFRDDIMRYKDAGNFEYKELRVYDLFDAQAYKCILVDFTLERVPQTPIWYPFVIKLFVYARMNNRLSFVLPSLSLATGEPNQLLNDINTFTNWIQTAGNLSSQIRNTCGTVLADSQLLAARLNTAAATAVNVVLTPLQIATKLVTDSTAMATAVYATYASGALGIQQYATFLESAHASINRALALWGYAAQNQGNATASQTIIYDAGLAVSSTDYSGASNDRNPSPQSYTFNGYKTYVVGGRDTLQRIAINQMGDENLWPFIALINNITSNAELVPNSTIYIPILNVGATAIDSYVVSSNQAHDPLGTDIALDADGNLLLGANDLVTVSGIANLMQAINTRLQTEEGQLIKQTAFGLLVQAGNAAVGLTNSYVQMAIESSLIQDPRIAQVQDVKVMVDGDAIYVTANLVVPAYPTIIPLYTTV